MKEAVTPSSWFAEANHRLDATPYATGAVATRIRLKSVRTTPLRDLTHGYNGGIFTPPIHNFRRNYVSDAEFGVPFLGSTSMLHADLGNVPLLAKRDAFSPRYRMLRIEYGMSLVSCSGTIGRIVFARRDMEGMWSSGDVLKIQPDPDRVPPGYVNAFLRSSYGLPLITSGTYGSIIQHIEAYHVADLPIPRLSDALECRVHELVAGAASRRTEAVELLAAADAAIHELLAVERVREDQKRWAAVEAAVTQTRFDAQYYSPRSVSARTAFDGARRCEQIPLGELADVFIPGIFKRQYAEDPAFGYPYVTGADVFQLVVRSDRFLRKVVAESNRLVVDRGTILIQEAGQLGGLIGRGVLVGRQLDRHAVSNNMVRVKASLGHDTGYIFAALNTTPGVTLVAREAAGSSIPHLDADRVRCIRVPWAKDDVRERIGNMVLAAYEKRDDACDLDEEACRLLENAIEEAA